MNAAHRQARQVLSAGLLLFWLAACAGQPVATATSSPASTRTAAPSATEPPATAAPQSRSQVETYIVQPGDTLTSIAVAFNLQPETLLWANYDQLLDVPDFLFTGMELTILPVDGVYHQVGGGDTITNIAAFFAADPQAIIDWPANQVDPNDPTIFAGQWLLVPGGQRALRSRSLPNLPRFAMAVDFLEFGSGACPQNTAGGAVGDGIYAWPVSAHELAGDGFWAAHPAADLAAADGEPVLAADDGVVVFSGWSNFGYGNAVMLDHGNGQFSLYAGLAEAAALCGASIAQGEALGSAGISGHPAGPYVHFEIRSGDEFLDPLDVLPE